MKEHNKILKYSDSKRIRIVHETLLCDAFQVEYNYEFLMKFHLHSTFCSTKGQAKFHSETERYVTSDPATKGHVMSDRETEGYVESDPETKGYVKSDPETEEWVGGV